MAFTNEELYILAECVQDKRRVEYIITESTRQSDKMGKLREWAKYVPGYLEEHEAKVKALDEIHKKIMSKLNEV